MKDNNLYNYYHAMIAHHNTEIMRLKNSREEFRFANIELLTKEIKMFSEKLAGCFD